MRSSSAGLLLRRIRRLAAAAETVPQSDLELLRHFTADGTVRDDSACRAERSYKPTEQFLQTMARGGR